MMFAYAVSFQLFVSTTRQNFLLVECDKKLKARFNQHNRLNQRLVDNYGDFRSKSGGTWPKRFQLVSSSGSFPYAMVLRGGNETNDKSSSTPTRSQCRLSKQVLNFQFAQVHGHLSASWKPALLHVAGFIQNANSVHARHIQQN